MANYFDEEKHDAITFLIFGLFIAITGIVLPLIMFFIFNGAENPSNLTTFSVYFAITIFFLGITFIDKIGLKNIKSFKLMYIHDYNEGILGWTDWVRNPLKLILVSLVAFGGLTIFGAYVKGFLVAIPQYAQIQPIANVYLAIEPVVTSETLLLMFLMGLGMLILRFLVRDNKSLRIFLSLIWAIPVTWLMAKYHQFAYPNSETAFIFLMFFFGLQAILIVLTGSILPAMIYHYFNNGILTALANFDKSIVISSSIIIWIMLIALFIFLIVYSRNLKLLRGQKYGYSA